MHLFVLFKYFNKIANGPANSPTAKSSFPVFFLSRESQRLKKEVGMCFTASSLKPSILLVLRYQSPHFKSSLRTFLFLNSMSENIKKSKFPFSLLSTFSHRLP